MTVFYNHQQQLLVLDLEEPECDTDAPQVAEDYELRPLHAKSLERHCAATRPNCACCPDTVPFTCVLKCVFVILLVLSVLSIILWIFLLEKPLIIDFSHSVTNYFVISPGTWNRPHPASLTEWKINIPVIIIAAVIYTGAVLRKLRKTTGSASHREEVPTISGSIRQV